MISVAFPRRVLSRLSLVVVSAACTDEAPLEPALLPSSSEAGSDAGAEPEPATISCTVPTFPDQSEPIPFERLEARVVDTEGRPVATTMAQACGVNLCLFGNTDDDGRVVHQEAHEMQAVAFKYGDGVRHAQLALLLGEGPEYELGEQVTVAFPELGSASRFEPGRTLRSGGVELVLEPTTKVVIDELTFKDDDERVFVASEFPEGTFPESARDQDFVALFALGPVKTKLCPPAKLVLPNSRDLAPGTELGVYLHSTDVRAEFAPYGGWERVGSATVTADGDVIETDPGQGLPMLGVIGLER